MKRRWLVCLLCGLCFMLMATFAVAEDGAAAGGVHFYDIDVDALTDDDDAYWALATTIATVEQNSAPTLTVDKDHDSAAFLAFHDKSWTAEDYFVRKYYWGRACIEKGLYSGDIPTEESFLDLMERARIPRMTRDMEVIETLTLEDIDSFSPEDAQRALRNLVEGGILYCYSITPDATQATLADPIEGTYAAYQRLYTECYNWPEHVLMPRECYDALVAKVSASTDVSALLTERISDEMRAAAMALPDPAEATEAITAEATAVPEVEAVAAATPDPERQAWLDGLTAMTLTDEDVATLTDAEVPDVALMMIRYLGQCLGDTSGNHTFYSFTWLDNPRGTEYYFVPRDVYEKGGNPETKNWSKYKMKPTVYAWFIRSVQCTEQRLCSAYYYLQGATSLKKIDVPLPPENVILALDERISQLSDYTWPNGTRMWSEDSSGLVIPDEAVRVDTSVAPTAKEINNMTQEEAAACLNSYVTLWHDATLGHIFVNRSGTQSGKYQNLAAKAKDSRLSDYYNALAMQEDGFFAGTFITEKNLKALIKRADGK